MQSEYYWFFLIYIAPTICVQVSKFLNNGDFWSSLCPQNKVVLDNLNM